MAEEEVVRRVSINQVWFVDERWAFGPSFRLQFFWAPVGQVEQQLGIRSCVTRSNVIVLRVTQFSRFIGFVF